VVTQLKISVEFWKDIVDKQKNAKWGEGFLKQLSLDLTSEFSGMKGFSEVNLSFVRGGVLFYTADFSKSVTSCDEFAKQVVAQLVQNS